MTTFLFKIKDLPPLLKTKQVAKVLFNDDSNANCQKIRLLTKRGQFPKPTIPSVAPGGTSYYATETIARWYQEKTNENKPLRSD
jgi:hypothetical protein